MPVERFVRGLPSAPDIIEIIGVQAFNIRDDRFKPVTAKAGVAHALGVRLVVHVGWRAGSHDWWLSNRNRQASGDRHGCGQHDPYGRKGHLDRLPNPDVHLPVVRLHEGCYGCTHDDSTYLRKDFWRYTQHLQAHVDTARQVRRRARDR